MLAQSKWYFPPFSRILDRVPALVHALVSQQDLRNRGRTHTHRAFGHRTKQAQSWHAGLSRPLLHVAVAGEPSWLRPEAGKICYLQTSASEQRAMVDGRTSQLCDS